MLIYFGIGVFVTRRLNAFEAKTELAARMHARNKKRALRAWWIALTTLTASEMYQLAYNIALYVSKPADCAAPL